MNSRAVKRIEDVNRLRQSQFPEDAGAMAHPIRPDSYVRMGEFPHFDICSRAMWDSHEGRKCSKSAWLYNCIVNTFPGS